MKQIPAINLLLDSNRGVYIPRDFAQIYADAQNNHELGCWQGAEADDIAILLDGPDQEQYHDAWEAVLDQAIFTSPHGTNDPTGYEFRLDQRDGDLWAVCDDLMSPDEYREFYGDEPSTDWWRDYADRLGLACYTLPAYWASALINGDASGLCDQEEAEIDEFCEGLGSCVDNSESFFSTHSDVSLLAGDMAIFLFDGVPQS